MCAQAVEWLGAAFGFVECVKIGEDHRAQLGFGDGALIVGDERHERRAPRPGEVTASALVRVEDAHAHCRRAREHGAEILSEPTDYEYGERQYHPPWTPWATSSPSPIAVDVAPEEWGGETVSPR